MNGKSSSMTFLLRPVSSHLASVSIGIPPHVVDAVYNETINLFTQKRLDGLHQQSIPHDYIEQNFNNEIDSKLKNYFFQHQVITFLFNEILKQKLLIANYPRLKTIKKEANNALIYSFDASLANSIELKEWKHFSFNPPSRKRYKDLDKQVNTFLNKHIVTTKSKQTRNVVEDGDWVYYHAKLITENNKEKSKFLAPVPFWLKVKDEGVINEVSTTFFNKAENEPFVATNLETTQAIPNNKRTNYHFLITIKKIVKKNAPSLEVFKNIFKLKNKAEAHAKLMEIFSNRNDQSQRKAIVEELFHLLLSKHRFEIPKHLIIRRQEDILLSLMQQSDYQVYKSQSDFHEQVALLGEKQLKEEILIDQITYKENLQPTLEDEEHYLSLFSNKKLREFIYFKPLLEKLNTTNKAINAYVLTPTILREKTLNYVIYTLTK